MEPFVIDCHTHTRDHTYIYIYIHLIFVCLSVCTSCIPAINLGRLQLHAFVIGRYCAVFEVNDVTNLTLKYDPYHPDIMEIVYYHTLYHYFDFTYEYIPGFTSHKSSSTTIRIMNFKQQEF